LNFFILGVKMPTIQIGEVRIDYDNTVDVGEVSRCDFIPYKIGSMKRTTEGYLKGEAAIAKVGIMSYLLADGSIRRELVTEETLFNDDSMNSLKLQPITDTHPEEVLLDKRTVKRRKVGMTGETIKRDGDFLVSSMAITDEDAIQSVEMGRQQLSPGYKCMIMKKSGVYKDEKYDSIQLSRVYNHVAICDRARGGSDLRINMDQLNEAEISHIDGFDTTPLKGESMKFRIDGIDYEATQEVINHITKIQTSLDSTVAKNVELLAKAETLQANVDSQKERIDSLEKRDIAKEITEGVAKRLNVLKVAAVVLDAEGLKTVDSLSDLDIKKAVITAKSPKTNLDGKSEVYLDARFDSIVETLEFDSEAISRQRKDSASRNDGSNSDPVEKAKLDAEKRITEGYLSLGK
jgi:hypothetical protein